MAAAAVSGDGAALRRRLTDLDGQGYGRYRSLGRTAWDLDGLALEIVRVQADPYAPPSRVELRVPAELAALPAAAVSSAPRRRAIADHLARRLADRLPDGARIDVGGQAVLDRSCCAAGPDGVRVRLGVALPARGRRILGRQAARLLADDVAAAAHAALRWPSVDAEAALTVVETVEDAVALRSQLADRGLVAFVADGSVLPRASGIDDRPLADAVPFRSPPPLAVELDAPNAGPVRGMGVPEGVTLVVGGGFHGKSTLLAALGAGVRDHLPGDGRERVVARERSQQVQAEDGRRVARVDVSAFVGELPTGADPSDLATEDASGSTSQAAAVLEALEAGAEALLVDEDTSATNLMVRDEAMAELVAADREPLTPFVDLVRPLHRDHGVSTVLVAGGSGDWFAVADRVVHVDAFVPDEVTEEARAIAERRGGRPTEAATFPPARHRVPDPASVAPRGKPKVSARGLRDLRYGEATVDVGALRQLVDRAELVAVGAALRRLATAHLDGRRTLAEALDRLDAELDEHGPDALDDGRHVDLATPRRLDVAGALNRLRTLEIVARW